MISPTTKIVSVRQLSRELGVSQVWLREEAEAGRIPALPAGGRNFVFDRESVETALAERASEPIGSR